MRNMVRAILLSLTLCTAAYATAQVHVSIGVNLPVYPEFVRVPGYPVYYAPRARANVFFYDGLYWVFDDDRWYSSTWYNGPWYAVDPDLVPLYVLRVPVRYYPVRPAYFRAWALDAPPRWGDRWGRTWEQRHIGWDRWDRRSVPAAAPLPLYQRQYSGSRYPSVQEQRTLVTRQYRYEPRDTAVREIKREQGAQSAREFAPGQVKKREGVQSAREFAPGHARRAEAPQVAVAPQAAPPGHGRGHARGHDDRDERGDGPGNGHGKAKGHRE